MKTIHTHLDAGPDVTTGCAYAPSYRAAPSVIQVPAAPCRVTQPMTNMAWSNTANGTSKIGFANHHPRPKEYVH